MVYHKSDWLRPSFGGCIYYLFVQNAAVNWVNTGCKLPSRSSDFFKFDIVCCQALLQVKANLCKCSNLGGYFLHRYQKPRARTNEVCSTERKNSLCLARGFDINFRCKHYVSYIYTIWHASFLPGWRAVLWKCPCGLLGVIKSYLFNYDWICIYLLWFHHRQSKEQCSRRGKAQ